MPTRRTSSKKSSSLPLEEATRSLIPMGMATLLPDAAQRVRQLEQILFSRFSGWGYREIIPPTFEYFDVLSAGLPAEILEKCYKFADWTTGRVLVLRPDVTAQIARIVAMGMAGRELPIRLSYRTTVFRYEPEHAGREREIFQLGIELIGADDAAMDAEVLLLLIESLKGVGLSEFTISIGHVGFYQALLAKSGLSERGRKQAEWAAAHKDLPRLERILRLERVGKKQAAAILEAPGRYGREEVLAWGRSVAGRDRALASPITRLSDVYQLLVAAGVQEYLLLDLGEFRGFDYYDGLVFDVFSSKVGCELGGGGRYNHLVGRFGQDCPSTGFALDVDRLFTALNGKGGESSGLSGQVLVVGGKGTYGEAFTVSQSLRSQGFCVVQEDWPAMTRKHFPLIQSRARQLSLSHVVLVGMASLTKNNKVLVLSATEGARRSDRLVNVANLSDALRS